MYLVFHFTQTELTPLIKIYDLSDNSVVVDDASVSEIGDGLYKYNFTIYDKTKDYVALCDGGESVTGGTRYIASGISAVDVNLVMIDSDSQSVTDLKDLVDTGYNPSTHGITVDSSSKSGYALSSSGIDSILDEAVDSTYTLRQIIRILFAVLAGKSSGGGSSTINFRNIGDTKNRVSATVDSNGNRTAITLDET